MLKSYMQNLYMSAHAQSLNHTLNLLPPMPGGRFLDLGCYDGAWTKVMADKLGCHNPCGVEILPGPGEQARARGIQVYQENLEAKWSFPDNHFDIVHSSFVIEHMASIDNFVSELFRVLKPGGYAVTTTENGSSWHNIFAAVLGWQTFSSSCCSTKTRGLGNPLALQRGHVECSPSMTHKVIFNYLGFKEIFQVYGFERLEMRGAGYYPLPGSVGNLDHRHAHFLILKAQKSVELGN